MRNEALTTKATDYRNPPLTRAELATIWDQANEAMHAGQFGEAFVATEALLCQAHRGNVCPDILALPMSTKLGADYVATYGEAKGALMLQSLTDRVESFNWSVRRRAS